MYAKVYSIESVKVAWLAVVGGNPAAISLDVDGLVNTGGWSKPELAPWIYILPPEDGILDLDFVALAPEPGTIVTQAFAKLNVKTTMSVPDWVLGVRVHASTNFIAERLAASSVKKVTSMPSPWPFPWFTPHITR